MVAMAVGRSPREHGDDDLRPKSPDDVQHVLQDRIARPEAERFVGRFREAEVVGAREELPSPVQLARRQQLFGANDPQLRPQLGADQILPALAAGQREVGRLHPHAARQQHEQLGVFIVGMGADHQDALVAAQLSERARQCGDAAGAGGRQLCQAGARGADTKEERY